MEWECGLFCLFETGSEMAECKREGVFDVK